MSRQPLPRKREPRQSGSVNDKQERFALNYLETLDVGDAYKKAGYHVASDEIAKSSGRRLLRNARVRAIIDDEKMKLVATKKNTAEKTVLRLEFVYLEAAADRNWLAAVSALKELGKFFGIYSADNAQRQYGPEDIEKLRKELEEAGMDFTRKALIAEQPSTN